MIDFSTRPSDSRFLGLDFDSSPESARIDWFGAGWDPVGASDHRLAEVVDGGLDLFGLDGRVSSRLLGLHRRIATAVVEGLPRPIECIDLSGCEDLIHGIEIEWRHCGHGFPTDPDVEGWIDVLVERTEARFVEWCFHLLRTLGNGTVERIEPFETSDGDPEQVWSTAEPELLGRDLAEALDGRAPIAIHDPLLSVRRIPA